MGSLNIVVDNGVLKVKKKNWEPHLSLDVFN